jgi:hypothetical protein
MNAGGALRMSGEMVPILISGKGFYAKVTNGIFARGMPDLPLKYRLRSAWYELALRVRIAFVGFFRSLYKGEGIGFIGRLHASRINGTGGVDHFGLVSTRVVTDAGVTYMRDDWNNNTGSADITLFNFHGCGVGTGAEAVGDTALGTESTTALNPDSTRATGTRSVPAGNQYRTVGTLTFDADAAVTEHGIFTVSGTGSGTLWDRSKFAAINVVGANGDSIQFTYTVTLSSGG